jgi:hypothetical protein
MSLKPMSVEQCVSEGLNAQRGNRSHHERVGARFRETDDDSQDARQSAREQARPCKSTSGGLINGRRMERIMQQAIGLITGGAEGAGDAQASERVLNGAIMAADISQSFEEYLEI